MISEPYDIQDVMDATYAAALRRKCERKRERAMEECESDKTRLHLHLPHRNRMPHVARVENVQAFEEVYDNWYHSPQI